MELTEMIRAFVLVCVYILILLVLKALLLLLICIFSSRCTNTAWSHRGRVYLCKVGCLKACVCVCVCVGEGRGGEGGGGVVCELDQLVICKQERLFY